MCRATLAQVWNALVPSGAVAQMITRGFGNGCGPITIPLYGAGRLILCRGRNGKEKTALAELAVGS